MGLLGCGLRKKGLKLVVDTGLSLSATSIYENKNLIKFNKFQLSATVGGVAQCIYSGLIPTKTYTGVYPLTGIELCTIFKIGNNSQFVRYSMTFTNRDNFTITLIDSQEHISNSTHSPFTNNNPNFNITEVVFYE